MNLSSAIASSGYYSSVQGEEKANGFKLGRSPSTASQIGGKDDGPKSSKFSKPKRTMSMMKSTAISAISKKFFLSPCRSSAPVKSRRRIGYDMYHGDDTTPVIYYADEDTVVKKSNDKKAFLDPYAFESGVEKEQRIESKKKRPEEQVCSPTSVFGLFTVKEENSFVDYCSDEDEAVFFDDPFFPRSLTSVFDENTSLDISESIHSINAVSVNEDGEEAEKDLDVPTEQWFGFFNAESFTSCEWDPEEESFD